MLLLCFFFWGVENFGLWLFLLSIPNLFLIFNINFQDAATQEITILNSKKKHSKANKIFQNSIVFNLINLFVITLLVFLAYFLNFFDLSIFEKFTAKDLKNILILISLSIYLNIFQSIFQTGINASGKLYINYNISIIIDLTSKTFIAISGYFFSSLVYPVIIYFLFCLIRLGLCFYYFSLINKYLTLSIKLFSKDIFYKITKLSIGHTADIISSLVKHSLVIFIIGMFLDPYLIGYIVTVKTLFYFFPARFFGKINHISLYEFASLYAQKKYSVIKQNIKKINIAIFILLILFVSISLTIGPMIYNFWTNNNYNLDLIFLSIILFDSFFYIFRQSLITFFMSINRYIFLGTSNLIITCLATFIFYILLLNQYSYNLGFFVILIGSFVSLVISLVFFWYCFKKLKMNK